MTKYLIIVAVLVSMCGVIYWQSSKIDKLNADMGAAQAAVDKAKEVNNHNGETIANLQQTNQATLDVLARRDKELAEANADRANLNKKLRDVYANNPIAKKWAQEQVPTVIWDSVFGAVDGMSGKTAASGDGAVRPITIPSAATTAGKSSSAGPSDRPAK